MKKLILVFCIVLSALSSSAQGVTHWRIENPFVSRCDAAFSFSPDYGSLISGRQILFEPMLNIPGLKSDQNLIPATIFPKSYNATQVSAALDFDEQSFLMFKGNVYVAVHKTTFEPLGNIQSWTGWPSFWKNDVDAALRWTDGSMVFIKGLQYVTYDPNSGETSRPAQMNRWTGWPSSWSGSIDAAFNGQDGYLYFIRQGEILAMDANTMGFAPGYPRKLVGERIGVNMRGTNLVSTQEVQNDQAPNQQMGGVDLSAWCAVGTPDAGNAPDGSNIAPMQTDLAGGTEGDPFRDKLIRGTRVKEVRVWSTNKIQAIEVVTESPEKFITEGGPKGFALGSPEVFSLVPGECITGIEGTWDGSSGAHVYTLKINTNKRSSPEFGGLGGRKGTKSFQFEVPPEGSFSGFHGRSSRNLDAIGIQYNIYQYVAWGENGELLETTGDKSAWNSGTQVQLEEAAGSTDTNDPWFDNHLDISETDAMENMFLFSIMPGTEAVGRSVDITKIDPWDLSLVDGRANRSPLVVLTDEKKRGSGNQKWFFPYGYNKNKSGQLGKGRSKNSVRIMRSFQEYTDEFGLQIGAEFQVSGTAAGSLNASHKSRNTTSIGKEKIMISKTYDILSHSCYVDLSWTNPRDGTKNRQKLNPDFREMVNNLPVPTGRIPSTPIEQLVYKGKLSGGVDRSRDAYEQLIAEFGTHFINNVQYGGWYSMMSEMSQTDISNGNMTETDVCVSFSAGADASPGGVKSSDGITINNIMPGSSPGLDDIPGATTVGASGCINSSSESYTSTNNSQLDIVINASGGGGLLTYAAWEKGIKEDPIVRNAEFFPISDLLSTVFFPGDEEIAKKSEMLRLVIKQHIRNGAELLTHNSIDSIIFTTQAEKDRAANAQQQADLNKAVELELDLMKFKCSEDDPGTEYLELYGKFECRVVDEDLKSCGSAVIFNVSEGSRKYSIKDKNRFHTINQKIKITTTKSKLSGLKIQFFGKIEEYDDTILDSDDLLMDISVNDAPATESLPKLKAIGEYSPPKEIQVIGKDGVTFGVQLRVKQVK